MQITREIAKKYQMKWQGKPIYPEEAQEILDRAAKNIAELPGWLCSRIIRTRRRLAQNYGIGIGDYFTPKRGAFADIPLFCRGFTCERIEPVFGLPAGKSDWLLAEPLYPDGMTTGLTLFIPNDEVF